VLFRSPQEPYPASPDGSLPETYKSVLDPLETLAFVAAHTEKAQLGASVIVLPYHTPIELARRIATIDVLSKGRAVLGCGVGWSHDEFEAVGTPFGRRGARSDECLKAMIALWTEDPVGFEGEFYSIPESMIGPKPVQKPYPPIYIAGFGKYAFDRAVKFGNGWNPAGVPSFEWLEDMIKQFRETASAAGRSGMEVVLRVFPVIFDQSSGGYRAPMMGTLGEIKEDVGRLRDIGVTEIIYATPEMSFVPSSNIDAALAQMEQLLEISR